MTVTGILTALIIGALLGAVGRFVAPGGRRVPVWAATLVGVLGAFVGTFLARLLGVADSLGIDWLEMIIQVIVASVLIAGIGALYGRRPRSSVEPGRTGASVSPPPPPTDLTPPVSWPSRAEPVPRARSAPPPPARTSPPPSRIFLCYRRTDSSHAAGRLADRLRQRYGHDKIFMDVDSLAGGQNFRTGVRAAINDSAVVLVLIGDRWADERDLHGRRLDNPADNVRQEAELALRLGRALPVLIDGADMPYPESLPPPLASLTDLNAAPLRHLSWDDDASRLIRTIDSRRPS